MNQLSQSQLVLPTHGSLSSRNNTLSATMDTQHAHAAPGSDGLLLGGLQNHEQQHSVDSDPISRYCGPREPIDRPTKPSARQNENRLDRLKKVPFATGRVGNLPPLHDEDFGQFVPKQPDDDDDDDSLSNNHLPQWKAYMAHLADQIGELNMERLKEGIPNPETYEQYLRDRSHIAMSNPVAEYETPAGQPASEYKPILEDVVKLFQQFEKVTMKSLLYETNYHFPTEIGGLPFWVSNIRAVAKECRWRYQRDRTALIKAFEHLLEAESLVRQPLGKREWEKLDIDDAALAKEWEENCVEHIDEIMGVLEKVEEQADVCVYDGNWEKGWTYRGCFPRGKKGREIGRRKRYSNDRSDEGGRQCPRVGKIRKPETRKRLPSHTSDKGCMQCSKGKWNKKVGIQKRYSKDQDR